MMIIKPIENKNFWILNFWKKSKLYKEVSKSENKFQINNNMKVLRIWMKIK